MNKPTSSKLLLKKIIQQNSIPSHLQSNPSVESWKRAASPVHLNEPVPVHVQGPISYRRGETSEEELKLESRVNNNELKLQSRVKHELKLQSRFGQQKRLPSKVNYNNIHQPQPRPPNTNQIQCLQIQSRIISPTHQHQINQLPLQTLESKLLTHKLKVHSSIDGLQTSKKSHGSSQKQKQKSLPISDLIITDNKYMKRSNGLNQHDTFSLAQEEEFLRGMMYENLKVLRQQTVQQIQLIERQLEQVERDELVEKLEKEIERVEHMIRGMKESEYNNLGTPVCTNNGNPSRNRSKTPQIRKLRTVKSQQHIINNKLLSPSQQQLLQRKLTQQRQRIKKQKQTSMHATQKLSKAKSAYKHLQLQLNFYENLHNQQHHNQFPHPSPQSPIAKSPLPKPANNYKHKYYQFREKQKKSYYQTLKQHVMVICKEIETVRMFGQEKCDELKQEIQLMKAEVRYLEVRGVEKFFFLEVGKGMSGKGSRDKANKRSGFKNNYSQKLISTYSNNSLHSLIPPLSPRTPYPPSPHLYSQSPQNLASRSPNIQPRSPRLKSRSPHIYSRSPHYSATSITPRSIRLKDMNKVSDKSTNHSQTKINKTKNQLKDGNVYLGELRGGRENKENNNETRKRRVDKMKRKEHAIEGKTAASNNNKDMRNDNRSKRKAFTNIRSDGEMRTEPSDEYCINSENEFRF